MNYSKAMIDLIMEARRRVPSEDKPSIKLANPDVLSELNRIYHDSKDTILKALIKEAFYLAGEGWPEKLIIVAEKSAQKEEIESGPRFITKIYRGQTQLIESGLEEGVARKPPQRIYRGQVVG